MKNKMLLIILMIAISLAGCTGSQQPLSSPSPSTPTLRSVPMFTATSSTPTSTATNTANPTAVPLLSPENAQATILDWLENNGDCLLPCIWKLEPGITTTQMRKNLLAPFESVEKENFGIYRTAEDENPGGIGYSFQSDETHYLSISLHYSEQDGYISYLNLLTDVSNNDVRVFDDANYKKSIAHYSLSQILLTYGPPSDIHLATWPHDPFAQSDYEPFIIVVVYSELGFRVEYVFEAEKRDDQIIGCPTESVLTITAWNPKATLSLQEIASIGIGHEFNGSSYKYFKPINEVTTMNVDEFYQLYAVEASRDCIATPAEIWYSGIP